MKPRWSDIVSSFADCTYNEVVKSTNECFDDWTSPEISELLVYLYTHGAYVKYLNTVLASPYHVTIDPTRMICLCEHGDTVAEGSEPHEFREDARIQMGARFMARYDDLFY